MGRIPDVISTMANRDILHGDSVEAFPGEGGELDPEVGDWVAFEDGEEEDREEDGKEEEEEEKD